MNYYFDGASCKVVKSKLFKQFPELVSACSTREGGVSSGIYSTMNLGFATGDHPSNVSENYEIICNELGIRMEDVVLAKQTHQSNIRIVTDRDRGKGVLCPVNYDDIDALITSKTEHRPSPVLTVITADCVPVSVYDPKHMAIGLAHSGWKGTVQQITAKMLDKMEQVYETAPEDVYLSIGPSICSKCYEVGKDVASEFKKVYNLEEWEQLFTPTLDEKYYLNLQNAVKITALKAGVPEGNIEIQGLCTCCNPKLLFSHRASQGKRGTLATFLGIR